MSPVERAQLADFALRFPGLTWAQLGRLFGVSPSWARIACTRYWRAKA